MKVFLFPSCYNSVTAIPGADFAFGEEESRGIKLLGFDQ